MAIRRADGSVYSENTPSQDFERDNFSFGIYRVLLTEILYVDDAKNMYGKTAAPAVVYSGVTVGGKGEGQALSNIRDALAPTGELNNYGERIYRVCSKPLTGTNAVPLNKQDGSIVYVAFVNGNPSFPIIVGRDKSALDRVVTGASKSDGPVRRWQYNGIQCAINKKGELTLKRKGGRYDSLAGVYIPDSSGNEVSLEWTEDKMVLNIGDGGIVETRDGASEIMTIAFESGLKVTYSGLRDVATIQTRGGAKISLDGLLGIAKLNDNLGGALKISNSQVALGNSTVELLQQISDSLDKLITWAETVGAVHTHIDSLGYPTTPPLQTADYLSLGVDLQLIKIKIDSLKGSL